MKNTQQIQRNQCVDLVKIIAIFGVVVIHSVFRIFYAYPVGSFHWLSGLFWRSIASVSVPLFLMCSGVLFLPPDKELRMKKLYTRYIPRLLVAMIFWAMAYKVYHLVCNDSLTAANLWYAFKRVLLLDQEFHFYYIHIMLLVYAVLPITRILTKYASQKQMLYALGLWFLLGVVYPTLRPFYPLRLLHGIGTQYYLNMTYAAIGYGILGYYLVKYPLKKWIAGLLGGFGAVVVFAGTLWLNKQGGGKADFQLCEGMSVGVCLMGIGIFSLCMQLEGQISDGCAGVFAFVSKGSFCVYLVHLLVLYIFDLYGFNARFMAPILAIPLLALIVLIVCLGIYFVLSRIPVVKNWLL